jgi:hypothetical protein
MTTSGMAAMSGEPVRGYMAAMPAIGGRVVTADGEELGTVREVADRCFKVDVAMQPDYWLGTDTIEQATGNEVRLNILKDRVGDFKLDGPEHSGVHRHTV